MFASWEALKMTFGVLPGICLVVWAGYSGWTGKRPSLRKLIGIWQEVNLAKQEGLKETARCLMLACATVGYLLFLLVLFLVPSDMMLIEQHSFCNFI